MQNMSATEFESVTLEDDIVVTRSKPGDFVVCNLSSINLGRAVPANVLERLIKIQVRMLDNVIDLNKIPVVQAAANKCTIPWNWTWYIWLASFTCAEKYSVGIR